MCLMVFMWVPKNMLLSHGVNYKDGCIAIFIGNYLRMVGLNSAVYEQVKNMLHLHKHLPYVLPVWSERGTKTLLIDN